MKSVVSILVVSAFVALGSMACSRSRNENAKTVNADQPSGTENANQPGGQQPSGGGHYKIDPTASQFTARIGVEGALAVFGHEHVVGIRDFSGDAQITPGSLQPASLQLTIKADSLRETEELQRLRPTEDRSSDPPGRARDLEVSADRLQQHRRLRK